MKEILLFAGTTEGRQLSEYLAAAGVRHTVCVATEYGGLVLREHPLVSIHRGRMEQTEIRDFIVSGDFLAVVDATHPYADAVTRNIKTAMEGLQISYLRVKRESLSVQYGTENITYFATKEECAAALEHVEGNILLTTGSRELAVYGSSQKVRERLYVRVLPSVESIAQCIEQGICGKQIIAMQGPFTADMNEAVLLQYGIACLVTKESGTSGGFSEKLEAAGRTGTKVFVVERPEEEGGLSFMEVCRELERICGRRIRQDCLLQITLAGIGMGSRVSMTEEVRKAAAEADILLGAERMLASWQPRLEKRPYYQAGQMIPYLKELQERPAIPKDCRVVVLFSGDSGFYSGCTSLYRALEKEIQTGGLRASLRILPGVSSVAALAARIGTSYQDAAVYSMHGRELPELVHIIRRHEKTFLLMSGVGDVKRLGSLLAEADMSACEVTVGYQLSYEEERVNVLSPEECVSLQREGLYVCMVENPCVCEGRLTHGIADAEFIRDKVPMTKEEVREISICKLHLTQEAVVYDIGSGTGSVAVEIACLSGAVQVYAVEQKKEAIALLTRNKEKFRLDNITVVEAAAPEGLAALPAATHAFIGGSGGRLKEILEELYRINPGMRIVVTAVSVETICTIRECLAAFRTEDVEMVQVQIGRTEERGQHHLLRAENPVWVCAFTFCE
ncbi:MAG: precorrin-6A reductase [Butyrivibrio sp.]|nr:precorrin-6A reductase [Butyrivibrio sp.]